MKFDGSKRHTPDGLSSGLVHQERQDDKNQTDDLPVKIQIPRRDLCPGDENKMRSVGCSELLYQSRDVQKER